MKISECPICGNDRYHSEREVDLYDCIRCGPYHIGPSEAGLLTQYREKGALSPYVSSHVRRLQTLQRTPPVLGPRVARALCQTRYIPSRKSRELAILNYIFAREEKKFSASLIGWAAIGWRKTASDAQNSLQALADAGYINLEVYNGGVVAILTDVGLEKLGSDRARSRDRTRATRNPKGPPLPRDAPLYATSLAVSNFRSFKSEQIISFRDSSGATSRWNVILGENGLGKTTILQLIGALYPVINSRKASDDRGYTSGAIYNGWTQHFRSGIRDQTLSHGFELNLCSGALGKKSQDLALFGLIWDAVLPQTLAELQIRFPNGSVSMMNSGGYTGIIGNHSTLPGVPVIAGYSADRQGVSPDFRKPDSEHTVASLFSNGFPLIRPDVWLLQADYAARFEGPSKRLAQGRLALIKKILARFIPGVDEVLIQPPTPDNMDPIVVFKTPFGAVPYTELSLGYQTAIALLVDLASRLFEAHPDSQDPLSQPAIVLIDEVDLHLHPKWQRVFINELLNSFPCTQFIVSSHSPLVAQADSQANLILLKEIDGAVVVLNDVDMIRDWRVDQILTSDLFGLDTARAPHIMDSMRRRNQLLSRSSLDTLEIEELRELESTLERLPVASDIGDEIAMRIIRSAAARVKHSSQ